MLITYRSEYPFHLLILLFLQLLPPLKTFRFVPTLFLFIHTELQLSVITVEKCCGGWCVKALNVKVRSFLPQSRQSHVGTYELSAYTVPSAYVVSCTIMSSFPWMSSSNFRVHGFCSVHFFTFPVFSLFALIQETGHSYRFPHIL